ncbi:MAG: D-2-hydroxyacid dehydrogenase [Saprospiraceae bacterium]|nr:D-2-hydroxyacid dehydrogenase [Saprospiraceae bacterium]
MSGANLKKRHEIVVTDGHTLNPGDLSWRKLQSLGNLALFEHTPAGEMAARAAAATILIVNKAPVDASLLAQLPLLECICVTATGFNNVDIAAAKARGIPVCNAVGYGTDSVAQHVFALLLAWRNQIHAYQSSVAAGDWSRSRDFCYYLKPFRELAGQTMGIYGFGRIGQKVAAVAQAFGMNVLACHKHPERDAMPGVKFVDLEALFAQSDVISLHAPLGPENEGIVNKNLLSRMKSDALLINTGRGGLIHEGDLREALLQKSIGGALLDVLSKEPPLEEHPLSGLENCLITPHIAWASREARERLMEITVENVQAFLAGTPQNVVNA